MVTAGVVLVCIAVFGLLTSRAYVIGLFLPAIWDLARQFFSIKRLAAAAGVAGVLVGAIRLLLGLG